MTQRIHVSAPYRAYFGHWRDARGVVRDHVVAVHAERVTPEEFVRRVAEGRRGFCYVREPAS